MPEKSLPPNWDAASEDLSTPRESGPDLFANTGISNLVAVARFTVACLVGFILLRIVGLCGMILLEPASPQAPGITGVGTSLFGIAGLVGWGVGSVLLVCLIIAFLVWLIGAANNAEAISGSPLPISPGWQAAWYFAPFFHLVMPAFGMHQIVSRSRVPYPDLAFLFLLLWWLTWILGTFGAYLARLQANASIVGPGYSPHLITIDVSSAVLTSTSAIFLIVLINIVTKSQMTFACAHPLSEESVIADDQIPV